MQAALVRSAGQFPQAGTGYLTLPANPSTGKGGSALTPLAVVSLAQAGFILDHTRIASRLGFCHRDSI